MPDLSASAESVLFALSEEERLVVAGQVTLQHLARTSGVMDERGIANAVRELEGAALTRTVTDGQRSGMVITSAGREAVSALSVLPPEGRVSEFVGELDGMQLAAIDTIVGQALRSPGGRIVKQSVIRANVRKAFQEVDIPTATRVIDALATSHIERSGDRDPSYLVNLRGLLASRWGSNALNVVGRTLDLLRGLHAADAGVRRFSWRTLRTAGGLPRKALNLTYDTIMLAKLGHGLTDDAGDRWWTVPSDLDILLECATALDYVKGVIGERQGQETAATSTASPKGDRSMTPTTEHLSILFMDLSGWSALRPAQVATYLEKALPKLAETVRSEFKARHLNTWGDALVAAFGSAREAAECALDIRDFFRRANEVADGVPTGLKPRIAVHVGEVFVAWNPLIKREDIFGDAVHVAARLEPKTEKGQVFCTQQLADALRDIAGLGPVAHRWGEVDLPKDYGRIVAFVVTGPNEEPPAIPPQGGSGTPTPAPAGSIHTRDPKALLMDRANAREFRRIIDSEWMVDWCATQGDYPQYVKREELTKLAEYLREADKPERAFREPQLRDLHTALLKAIRAYVGVSGKERIPARSAEGVYVISTKQRGEEGHMDDYDQRYQRQVNAIGAATDAVWAAWEDYVRESAPLILDDAPPTGA